MKPITNILLANSLILSLLSTSVLADKQNCETSNNIKFVRNDIFDLKEKDSIFIHNWANFFHIKTKEKTLLNESAFFLEKCHVNNDDLQELERHLRAKKYIRNAKVSIKDNKQISVETWDNWSLMPTLDLGRKGGQNKVGIGIKDQNLLGLGVDAEVEYFSDDQRTGYKLKSQFPLFLNRNINARIRFTSNDDGTSEAIFLQKKFVSSETKNAFRLGFNNFNQIDTQFENGAVAKKYRHKNYYSTARWDWLSQDSKLDTLRFGVGYTYEKHIFFDVNELNAKPETSIPLDTLPRDRSFSFPFVSMQYLQKDYKKLSNLNLISHIEDFNLGWNAKVSVGSDLRGSVYSPKYIWQSSVSKGLNVFGDGFMFFEASFDGETYDNAMFDNRLLFTLKTEYFHKINDNWGGYFKNKIQLSKKQFLDAPVVLGGETGVRGYPLQYQHGDRMTQFTFEARYYPHINIYKLLELGGAAFIDTGRVFGRTSNFENQSSWMTSVGLGARFYSSHSSEARVIHLDIIKPISSDLNVNSFEFRLTTKHSF